MKQGVKDKSLRGINNVKLWTMWDYGPIFVLKF